MVCSSANTEKAIGLTGAARTNSLYTGTGGADMDKKIPLYLLSENLGFADALMMYKSYIKNKTGVSYFVEVSLRPLRFTFYQTLDYFDKIKQKSGNQAPVVYKIPVSKLHRI